ncbi:hypothetical protein [Mesorhizobium sp. BE184]|uniref:hypothetical protein n=1 Tax=Mesorhizobium sp. BE184 TaxID=2817714 RepID=UPI00285FAA30|nr:hypothetical protein [Mesorhizobium sp. BE184]MDR7034523.1 hypothetical protein [Mesorhizobium sp. BE184]
MIVREPHPLGFATEGLPLEQLRGLIDALETVTNTLSGLQEWGVFTATKGMTEVGAILENLRNNIACEIDDIREEVGQRKVCSRAEADAKFDIILASMTWGGEERAHIVAKLATLSADLDWQVRSCPLDDGQNGGAS